MKAFAEPLLAQPTETPRKFGYWPFAAINHNVVAACLLALFHAAASAIWQGTVLTTFLFLVFDGSNSMVGFADAARGAFELARPALHQPHSLGYKF